MRGRSDGDGGPTTYEKMTDAEYDEILAELIRRDAGSLLTIPGVYEATSEHYNNEILDLWEKRNPGKVPHQCFECGGSFFPSQRQIDGDDDADLCQKCIEKAREDDGG